MRCILLGPPGAGKGTQAAVIRDRYNVAHISTGDILRSNVKEKTDLGQKARSYMEAGELVPDSLIIEMMRERLSQSDCNRGFLLDGFPRTVSQAEALDSLLEDLDVELDAVILLDVSDEVVVERLSGRRVCRDCGAIYHMKNHPPKKEGICDLCGGELFQRKDDTEEVIRQRLGVYHQQTSPLIEYYRSSGILKAVNAEVSSDSVLAVIEDLFGKKK
jgi:adenylate kinase